MSNNLVARGCGSKAAVIGSGESNERRSEMRAAASVTSKGEGIGKGKEPEGPVKGVTVS